MASFDGTSVPARVAAGAPAARAVAGAKSESTDAQLAFDYEARARKTVPQPHKPRPNIWWPPERVSC